MDLARSAMSASSSASSAATSTSTPTRRPLEDARAPRQRDGDGGGGRRSLAYIGSGKFGGGAPQDARAEAIGPHPRSAAPARSGAGSRAARGFFGTVDGARATATATTTRRPPPGASDDRRRLGRRRRRRGGAALRRIARRRVHARSRGRSRKQPWIASWHRWLGDAPSASGRARAFEVMVPDANELLGRRGRRGRSGEEEEEDGGAARRRSWSAGRVLLAAGAARLAVRSVERQNRSRRRTPRRVPAGGSTRTEVLPLPAYLPAEPSDQSRPCAHDRPFDVVRAGHAHSPQLRPSRRTVYAEHGWQLDARSPRWSCHHRAAASFVGRLAGVPPRPLASSSYSSSSRPASSSVFVSELRDQRRNKPADRADRRHLVARLRIRHPWSKRTDGVSKRVDPPTRRAIEEFA